MYYNLKDNLSCPDMLPFTNNAQSRKKYNYIVKEFCLFDIIGQSRVFKGKSDQFT